MTLSVIQPERARIREDVVKMLEEALEEARQGSIAALGIAVVRPDNHVNCNFTGYDIAGVLLGATALLQSRILASMRVKD